MPVGDLDKLWKLHLIDEALHNIRARAAALDPGRKAAADLAEAQKRFDEANAISGGMSREITDLDLAQKSAEAKIKKIEGDIYGGKVVNPREVELFQKEIVALKRQISDSETRSLELMEAIEPALAATKVEKERVDHFKGEVTKSHAAALEEKTRLEAAFKEAMAQRPAALKAVNPVLIPKYEAIVKKHGTGMARITKTRSCGACGLNLAEKTIENVKEERWVTCEQCHRALYYSDSVL